MNILITGVAGCIGSNFANWILENHPECNIIGLDDLSGGYIENIDPRIKFYLRDCGSDLEDIFTQNEITHVAHFAAYAAERVSPFLRKFNYHNNVVNTSNVINCCIKFQCKILFTSSISVYGRNSLPYLETQIPMPIDPYGIAKYAIELDLENAHDQHGLRYTILRPHSVIGVQQNLWDKYRNVISIWMRQILNNEPITITGSGNQLRAFTWAQDVMPCFWECLLGHDSLIFNIGSDKVYSLNQVADILEQVVEFKINRKYTQNQHEIIEAYSDHTLSKELLNFKEKTDLETMLKEMWLWAKKQPKKEVKSWYRFEIDNGLYDVWKENK